MVSELEMEIGRKLGASAFLAFQFIKHNPGSTPTDTKMETGLSECTVWTVLKKLRDSNVVTFTIPSRGQSKTKSYRVNPDNQTWKIH